MPKKKIISVEVDTMSPSDFEGTLADARQKINELIDEYGPVARLDWNRYFYYDYATQPSPRFELYVDREETDEEFEKRVVQEKKLEAEQEKRDRKELVRLQKKLGEK